MEQTPVAVSESAAARESDAAERLQLRSVSKSFGPVMAVDSLTIGLRSGQMLALLGPSGCGKTTTLRMVAGLERPTSGEIILDGKVLASASHSIAPERRDLGMVFQSYALWPHMSVFDNVAYGLRRRRASKDFIRTRVDNVLELAGMSGYEKRPAMNLSGGQQQRVAVARALATRPRILLFDEPLSNLDAVLREWMRFEIRSLQQENDITAIYVTHSQEEALAIADVIAVMNEGELLQLGSPEELYSRPRNRFVAGFIGLANVFGATVHQIDDGVVVADLPNGVRFECVWEHGDAQRTFTAGDPISVAVRPENVRMEPADGSTSRSQVTSVLELDGVVAASVFSGNLIDYFIDVAGLPSRIRAQSFAPAHVRPGDQVMISMPRENCVLLED